MAITTIRGGRQITDSTIPYADIQNVTANSVLGNNTASATSIQEIALASNTLLGRGSTGNITAITLSTGLEFSGTVLQTTANLRSLNALAYASNAFVKMTGANTFTLDTNTYLTSVTDVSGYAGTLIAEDNRTISPSELTAARLKFGFTSWNNDNNSPYADFLHLRSYSDNSGGNDNLVVFRKDAIGMRIYQQTFGSATAYSSFKDVAWTDGTNASGTWGISITGSSGTAATWTTARTLTIGGTGKSVNGSADVSWTLGEIGAAAASHTHSAADITSGTLGVARGGTGATTLTGVLIGNGTSAVTALSSSTALQVLRVNGAGNGYEFATITTSGIGGSTGSTDNSILRADGTGGSTLQNSNVFISDLGSITLGTSSGTTSPFTIKAEGTGGSDISLDLTSNRNGAVSLICPGSLGTFYVSRLRMDDLGGIVERYTGSSNNVASVLNIYRSTTSTVQAGIGGSLQFVTQTSLTPNYETGGIIESVSTSVTSAAESFDLVFKTMSGGAAAAERARLTSAGQLNVQTSIDIASSGLVLSQGRIQFPATANVISAANTLDDYEEGDWTPTYVPQTSAFTTLTYGTARSGKYQKIGNRVYISGILTTNNVSIGTASGDLRIGGLPFTMSSATTADACMMTFVYVSVWDSEPPSTAKAATTSTVTLYRQRNLTTDEDVALTPGDMTTGAITGANECWFFGYYNTSS